MLKIRLQGTKKDIKWFKKIMEHHSEVHMLGSSGIYGNKGTNQYFRMYAEIEKAEE